MAGSSASTATARWRAALESWAIPEDILAAAPQSPYGFSVRLFERAAEAAMGGSSPTTAAMAAALPPNGSVLDIGCGAGAASLPVAGMAGELIGVDSSADMLAAFAARARGLGVGVMTQVGRWPDIAGEVGIADVAVARNVAYNVPDLAEFASAMTAHARERAVLELTVVHPLSWMNPLWRVIHGIERPSRPTLDDAVAVLSELGLEVVVQRWTGASVLKSLPADEVAAFVLQRLCVGQDRAGEVRAALAALPPLPPRSGQDVATVWWAGGA